MDLDFTAIYSEPVSQRKHKHKYEQLKMKTEERLCSQPQCIFNLSTLHL